jgi:hypothetical protein
VEAAETALGKDGVKGGAEDGSHPSHHRESELHLALRVWIGEGKEEVWIGEFGSEDGVKGVWFPTTNHTRDNCFNKKNLILHGTIVLIICFLIIHVTPQLKLEFNLFNEIS